MIFLVVPFLRFTRAFVLLRLARVGSVVSAAVRGSRSAGRLLTGRVAWLTVVTAVVVLASRCGLGHGNRSADVRAPRLCSLS